MTLKLSSPRIKEAHGGTVVERGEVGLVNSHVGAEKGGVKAPVEYAGPRDGCRRDVLPVVAY